MEQHINIYFDIFKRQLVVIHLGDFHGFIFVVFIFGREVNICLFIVCLGGCVKGKGTCQLEKGGAGVFK